MLHCFDHGVGPGPGRPGDPEAQGRDEAAARRDRWLVCADCGYPITREEHRTERDGQHQHTQMNPHGVIHRVALYTQAPGCVPQSDPEAYWSWFTGYAWTIVGCGGCAQHLGWRFDAPSDQFYGLLPERLAERV